MAEPVTVVWWTADASLFESIVHPGPDEAFVALYPLRPAAGQRATLVAVVDRESLPTARGLTIGHQEGTTVTAEPTGELVVLDLSMPASPRTRTPPWDLMPRDRWVVAPPSTGCSRFVDRRSRTGQVVVATLLVTAGLAAMYCSVLIRTGGDAGRALQAVAGAVVLGLLVTLRVFLVPRSGRRDEDVDERVSLRRADRRRLVGRGPR